MSKKIIAVLVLFSLPLGKSRGAFKKKSAFNIDISKERCGIPSASEIINRPETSSGMKTAEQIKILAEKIYASPKRLANRTWYDHSSQKFISYFQKERIEIPVRLIRSVTTHIETALAMGYAKNIIFSDMGHAHLLVPLNIFNAIDFSIGLKKVLSSLYDHPQSKFLYHTAEQLKMLDENKKNIPNRYLQQRLYTRNLVADNSGSSEIHLAQAPGHRYNTAHFWPGHRYMTGFDISANHGGCFSYFDEKNNLRYFDLSPMGHYPIGHHPDISLDSSQENELWSP